MNQHLPIDRTSDDLRNAVVSATWRDESALKIQMQRNMKLDAAAWVRISATSTALIKQLRATSKQPLIDQFLTKYSLSSDEGVQLMQLAEALSRTTDAITADELIQDKIVDGNWFSHNEAGQRLAMSISGWALYLTDKWLQWSKDAQYPLTKLLAKIGNAKLRFATRTAIKALSSQFVFAETLEQAIKRAKKYGRKGYLFSFDMLGEAARTKADAEKYYTAYDKALDVIARHAKSDDPRQNHGISIKLSALHPRYEYAQAEHVVPQIAELLLQLAVKSRKANVQITIDAEEAERLDISMDVFTALIAAPELKGWQGLGFVVQAYQRRALPLLDWLMEQSRQLGAPLFIRLVKGAYWDSEIKRAQEMGLESYPVFTRKEMTDLSYLACAQKLLAHPDHFRPQFATHNAASVAAVQELAGADRLVEFQRLFGMGQQLHDNMLDQPQVTSRIYAPVGTQKDLLSYLIRRLLENGANSSFVHKLSDPDIELSALTQDPISAIAQYQTIPNHNIPEPRGYLFANRKSAAGWDLSDPKHQAQFQKGLEAAAQRPYLAAPIIAGREISGDQQPVYNPAVLSEHIGFTGATNTETVEAAIETAHASFASWSQRPAAERATTLENAANLLEQRAGTFHYLAVKEAGKTWNDAVDEVREAVDFCRYYAEQAKTPIISDRNALGVIICISPWNFPLAIFLGQVTAALAAGNTVVAKPAEQTPLIAAAAIRLLHDAGIDAAAVNLVLGNGAEIGDALVSHSKTAAVCFTGSTATAKRIVKRLAELGRPLTPLIAETGGINAMIVDSSALLEQTIDAVVSSAFQSAGQRCSALRILCLQDDIADDFMALLSGAMDALKIGNPRYLDNDIGPIIDANAKQNIAHHIDCLEATARKIGSAPAGNVAEGHFVCPVAYELNDFADLDREIFGPVLHIVRFKASKKIAIVDKINQSGFGLTLGIQSRIDGICDTMCKKAEVGNIYINRNQIGAVVGVQPFGGQGLSGTGPKAGGPLYLLRLTKAKVSDDVIAVEPSSVPAVNQHRASSDLTEHFGRGIEAHAHWSVDFHSDTSFMQLAFEVGGTLGNIINHELVLKQHILTNNITLASPAGETNIYSFNGRGLIISVVQNQEAALIACARAIITGNSFLQINREGSTTDITPWIHPIIRATQMESLVQQATVTKLSDIFEQLQIAPIGAVLVEPDEPEITALGNAVAARNGVILPILTVKDLHDRFVHEKTITCNVAAAGGDISLLNT